MVIQGLLLTTLPQFLQLYALSNGVPSSFLLMRFFKSKSPLHTICNYMPAPCHRLSKRDHKLQFMQQQKPRTFSPQSITHVLEELKKEGWQNYFFIPHMFANLTTIIVCFLFYGVYILLDEYLHTILLSVLVGTSLKPIKNAFVIKLLKIIYSVDGQDGIYEPLHKKLSKSFIFNTEGATEPETDDEAEEEALLVDEEEEEEQEQDDGKIKRTKSLNAHKVEKRPKKDPKSHKNEGKNMEGFSPLKPHKILRGSRGKAQKLTKTQTVLRILWQILVIAVLVFVFYLIQEIIGLVILFVILVGEYFMGITYQIFKPIIKPLLRLMFTLFEKFFNKSNLKKYLSKFLSVLFIVLVFGMIILTIVFSVILIHKDVMNIKDGISEDFVKKDFMNYSSHFQRISNFIVELNVTQSISDFLPKQQNNVQTSLLVDGCIDNFNKYYVLSIVPESIKSSLCNIYIKYDYQTLQNVYPLMKQVLVVVFGIVGLSFSSVYGVVNFVLIGFFKTMIFLSTTYYIVEDYNLNTLMNLLSRFVNVSKSKTDKITEMLFEIKNIMFGSVKIAFLHFLLSWVIFDFFEITNFNFIISLFLGFMALVPIYHPFIGALLVLFCSWMYRPDESLILMIVISVMFLSVSTLIFNITYARISMPSIMTNLSVILGVYSFGILGIVYGPIIITILRGLLNELRKY